MGDIVDLFGPNDGSEPLQCKECGEFRFFLYSENIACCTQCEATYGLVRLGPLHIHELK